MNLWHIGYIHGILMLDIDNVAVLKVDLLHHLWILYIVTFNIPMMEGWTFDAWSKKHLCQNTIDVLIEEELKEINILLHVTENDILALKIPAGQRIGLRKALELLKLEVKGGTKPVTTKDLQSDKKIDELAKLLCESGDMLQDTDSVPVPNSNDGGGTGKNSKVFLIPDFIINSKVTMEREEECLDLGLKRGTLVFRSARQKKPEDITMPQWTAANSCICLKLIENGNLVSVEDVKKYMEHTRNIGELAQVNTISSVMQYHHL